LSHWKVEILKEMKYRSRNDYRVDVVMIANAGNSDLRTRGWQNRNPEPRVEERGVQPKALIFFHTRV
jgi:hypothetical protein